MSALQAERKPLSTLQAYLLLIGFVAVLFLALKPWLVRVSNKQQELRPLQVKLNVLQEQAIEAQAQSKRNAALIVQQIQDNLITLAQNENEVQIKLQSLVKSATTNSGTSLRQMRQIKTARQGLINATQLEINLNATANSIAPLLDQLQNQELSPKLISMSLRSNRWAQSDSDESETISVTATLEQSWVQHSSLKHLKINRDQLLLNEGKVVEILNTSNERALPSLAGLFDLNARTRNRSEDLQYYTVSAISLSESSQSALVTDSLNNKTQKLKIGDTLNQWTLVGIQKTGLTFEKEAEMRTLRLNN